MNIDRLVGIIMALLEKKRIGARELSAILEVSLRTIYRDIDAVNMACIPVLATPGAGKRPGEGEDLHPFGQRRTRAQDSGYRGDI